MEASIFLNNRTPLLFQNEITFLYIVLVYT